MIRDARVLQSDFVPREVEHRDAEVDALSSALEPVTRGDSAETTFLFGPSGTGKSCIARYALAQLRETVIDVDTQYVNCWQHYTRFRALHRILDGVGQTRDVHRQSTATDELLERIYDYDGAAYVVVLDEVDQLEDKRLLYDLYRTPGVSMVLIANRERDLFADLDERLTSRLRSSRRVQFNKYGIDELVAILSARAKWGFEPDAVDREQLARIADAAAGDARVAIAILRNAARVAEREELTTIPAHIVDEAVPEARAELRQKDLDGLSPHQRTLYEIIAEHGEIDPGELYGQYREQVNEPKTNRTLRNYLRKMCHYNLVVAEGENRARTYRVVD